MESAAGIQPARLSHLPFWLTEERVDRITASGAKYALTSAAMLTVIACLPRAFAYGAFTAAMVLYMGVGAHALRRWKTERGLWMLAIVIAWPVAAIFFMFIEHELRPLIGGWLLQAQPAVRIKPGEVARIIGLTVDSCLAAHVLWLQLRLYATVTYCNWHVKRSDWEKVGADYFRRWQESKLSRADDGSRRR
jgi:hypothetical protein